VYLVSFDFIALQNVGVISAAPCISICIIAIYRAPTGNCNQFISRLHTDPKKLYAPSSQFIICGDMNINYLIGNEKKNQLDALLLL
jgi:hypothetical protein